MFKESRRWNNITMEQDEQVVVIVDGDSEDGNFNLNVSFDECPDEDLPSTVPQVVMGSTSAQVNSSIPSCSGGTTAPDYAYTFTAPSDGTYIFDTNGSDYDTILYAVDGESCDGSVTLACNDDGGDGLQSLITLDLVQDQTITIIVDGFSSNSGNYTLNINQLDDSCPNGDLGSTVPQTVMGSTAALANNIEPGCGLFGGSPDFGYTFTAPADGMYTFDTNGSTYDTVLHITDGAMCGGMELGCDDDGGVGTQSQLSVNLVQDQQVVVMVDGYNGNSGPFTLNVN